MAWKTGDEYHCYDGSRLTRAYVVVAPREHDSSRLKKIVNNELEALLCDSVYRSSLESRRMFTVEHDGFPGSSKRAYLLRPYTPLREKIARLGQSARRLVSNAAKGLANRLRGNKA